MEPEGKCDGYMWGAWWGQIAEVAKTNGCLNDFVNEEGSEPDEKLGYGHG